MYAIEENIILLLPVVADGSGDSDPYGSGI